VCSISLKKNIYKRETNVDHYVKLKYIYFVLNIIIIIN
jgi:hypothetical protein